MGFREKGPKGYIYHTLSLMLLYMTREGGGGGHRQETQAHSLKNQAIDTQLKLHREAGDSTAPSKIIANYL